MIFKSIKNKNTRSSIILIILFVLYWFFVFLEYHFSNSFLDPVFESMFWQILMLTLGFVAILSPFFIIADAIKGSVESSSGTEKAVSKLAIFSGLVFLIFIVFIIFIFFSIKG
ncbi:MAG: hypothetical protein PHQ18_03575 [Patescibacteria group bacterium]|nr:hypothetical protein [Patescibacteria group bacterium]